MLNFIESIQVSLKRHGKKRAISFYRGDHIESFLSYLELDQDSNRMANQFAEMGIKKGDRVVILLNKSLIFIVAHLALQKMGAVSVPLNPGFKHSELDYLLKDAEPKLVLSDYSQETIITNINPALNTMMIDTRKPYEETLFFRGQPMMINPEPIQHDDPGLIIYTSGTTGKPKGAILTQKNLAHDTRNILNKWEIAESDTICHALPLFHVHGLCFALHTSLSAGSHIVMLDKFAATRVIETLQKKDESDTCTLFMGVPAMYNKMMERVEENASDFEHIRLWTSGSAPLLPQDFEKIKNAFGKEPVEREGMSETGMNFSNPLNGEKKPGSIGFPFPNLEVRIVDPKTFADVKPGQTGEIWLKGPAITPGYWKKPEETAKAFEQKWFRTGDLGRIDKLGYYYITDRIKNIIITGGENVSPNEVEAVINQLECVAGSCVVGVPDEKWGERVVAAVIKQPGTGITTDEIQTYCRKHLQNWKCPKEVVFLDELPKNTMGKILKEAVKGQFVAK
jgi:malonyl-CoA/methylmalonyl-CoA synthetase